MKKHTFKQRLLDGLKSKELPKVMLFTDTETHSEVEKYAEVQKFTLGWIFTWESERAMDRQGVTEKYFIDPLKYCRYFETSVKKYSKIHVCGHNIFFDLQCAGFFKYFTEGGWILEWLYDKGLTYILRISKGDLKIILLSTTNYFDCSLKELGSMLSFEKLEISLRKASKKELKRYCHRDTEIILRAMWYYIRFIRDNDLGRFALTKSSQSMVSYRSRFMTHKIFIHNNNDVFTLEREAYKGGRTEAFRIGEIPGNDFVTLDVNSMYPFVMQAYKYPSKLVCYMEDEPDRKYTEILGGYGMIAEVELDTPEPVYAVRHKLKLIFPTGQFRAFLCSEALRYAVQKGHIKRFVRAAVYSMDDLFSEYVLFFQDLRKKYTEANNQVMVKLCKYMHNSLYGKWGERDIVTVCRDNNTDREYLRREIWDSVNGGLWTETYFMNKILMQHYEGEGFHSFPAIAAHITENARLELWHLINDVGRDRVLYCDTDSIIIYASDLKYIEQDFAPGQLGSLKIQDRFTRLRIDGAKNYRTDKVRHIKGIPEGAVEISPGVFRFDSFQRQVSCLRQSQIVGVKIEPVTRSLKQRYDKGNVDKEGKVTPYHFTFFVTPS